MESRTITKHYFISGRVQGVGFRAYIRRIAEDGKLAGWVRNLPDGRVEVMVRGTGPSMKLFESLLRGGPKNGEVKSVEVSVGDPHSIPNEFEIRKDSR